MAGPEMSGGAAQFDGAARVIRADDPAEVPAALTALESARAAGKWLAGYASYELGYALEDKLAALIPETRRLPLLCFGVFDGPEPVAPLPEARPGSARCARAGMRINTARPMPACMTGSAPATSTRPT